MSIDRVNAGDCSITLSLSRDGAKIQTEDGAYNLITFLRSWEIYESIESATIEAMFIFEDSAGLSNVFTGSELINFEVRGSVVTRKYNFRSYNITSRVRVNQTTDAFIIHACSDEFIKNESTNVFGNSEVIFKQTGTESTDIVKTLVGNTMFLGSAKKVFAEESLNKHKFIAPNWRPLDAIYWVTQRTIRKKKTGGSYQNGYTFFENALGFHFKSIDGMIDDINNQDTDTKTDFNTGKARLYKYSLSLKKVDSGATDQFKIETVNFPEERNFLMGLRHGAWSGYSVGFDPVTINQSRWGGKSPDLAGAGFQYRVTDIWKTMSHLGGKKSVNPVSRLDDSIKNLIDNPKRVRYSILPNQIFDKKWYNYIPGLNRSSQKNYEALVELQAYQWLRMETLKNTKLQITVPGNLDLYGGYGIDVTLPSTVKSGDKIKVDKRFSGRYMIVTIAHKGSSDNFSTEMLLMKDAVT
tara:strand:+ start:417 stop:1817 length:1401 start_codon:yes stop_codon:yes gene_type:complete